ncbi:MAG: radical SAM/SPASM domain-containing protein [Candidatus Micrarchaeota archaeon]
MKGMSCKTAYNNFLAEYSYYHKEPISKAHAMLFSAESTNFCNLRCVMCSYNTMSRKKEHMLMDIFKRVIDQCKEHTRFLTLNNMGEPLLNPNLSEMIKYAKSKGVKVGFSSNAVVLDEKNAKMLIEAGLDTLLISFDGLDAKTYESIRVGGKFEEVKKNVINFLKLRREMNSKNPHTIVQMIKMKKTEGGEEEYKKFWEDAGADIVLIKPFGTWGGQVKGVETLAKDEQKLFDPNRNRKPCQWLWRNMLVLNNGDVTVCCQDYNGKYVVGNMMKNTLDEIWNGPKMQTIRKQHISGQFNNGLCDNCRDWLGNGFNKTYPFNITFLKRVKRYASGSDASLYQI